MLFSFRIKNRAGICVILAMAGFVAACGNIVDKDRIRVARIGDEYVTRGDLYRYLRLMSPEERPNITNRGDLLQVLEKYIDEQLQDRLVSELLAEGAIEPPPVEQVEQLFNRQHPEMNINPANPEDFDLTQADVEAIQQQRQGGIEKLRQQLLRREAVLKGIEKALESGELEISDEEYEREYEWRQDELFKPEKATVRALVFPVQSSEAGPNSAEARKMLVKGAPWEEVVKKFTEARQAIPLQTTMVNAGQPKFQSFWEQASGAQQGKILGPLIVEDWEMVVPAANGQTQRMPLTGYLVAEVLDRVAPEQMTLEEAKQQLAPELYYVKYLKQLREEAGVDIDEEKLPEPGLFLEEQEATI